jgi:hypothetical protein
MPTQNLTRVISLNKLHCRADHDDEKSRNTRLRFTNCIINRFFDAGENFDRTSDYPVKIRMDTSSQILIYVDDFPLDSRTYWHINDIKSPSGKDKWRGKVMNKWSEMKLSGQWR